MKIGNDVCRKVRALLGDSDYNNWLSKANKCWDYPQLLELFADFGIKANVVRFKGEELLQIRGKIVSNESAQ